MAKQLVNPFERHVEKIILAIALLLLIGVLVKFVFSSPNKVILGQEPATPSNIDSRLAQKANEVLERMRVANPPELEHDPKFEEFVASLKPLSVGVLPLAAAINPPVPIVDQPDVALGRAKLVQIPAPPKPVFTTGRNTILVSDPQLGDVRTPVDWVTLAIPFDVRAQTELQRRAWGATLAEVIFATPEVQRRAQREDGTWSDGDWQPITPSPEYKMPEPPRIRLTESDGKVNAPREDRRAAEDYQSQIASPSIQLAILRPMPPNFTKDENPWKFPLVTTYEAVIKQDQEFLFPNDPAAAIEDRYGLQVAAKPKAEPRTPAQMFNQTLDEARTRLDNARRLWDINEATRGYNAAIGVFGDKDAPADVKQKAQKIMKDAELLIQDIRYRPVPPGGTVTAGGDKPKARERLSQQNIWVHDAAPGSIVNGKTYQYRIRSRVLNRLAGSPESFENPLDAQVMIVAGEWSEPTDPIHIAEDSWFFVTRDDKNNREVYLEFFRWYDGVWVKSSAAKFNEGDRILHQQRVSVPDREDRSVAATPTVDFGEDLALLDVEFARPIRERKAGSTAAGVKFGAPAPVAAAVFVDGNGGLVERLVPVDKDNPLKRKIEVWSPPRR